jgi:hypothetical protein
MMQMLKVGLVILLVQVSAAMLAAQELAPACANPTLAQLRFLEGAWIVQARSRLSASPTDWETTVATSRIEREMRGCLVLERYTGTRRGSPYEALRVFAAKAEDRRLQVVVSDSAHGPLFLYEGSAEPGGLAFYMPVKTAAGSVLLRLRFNDIGAEAFVAESQRSVDDGKTWDTTGRAEYRRRRP